jgi:hypothetical protein
MKMNTVMGPLTELGVALGISVCIMFPSNADVVAAASVIAFLAFLINRFYSYSTNVKLQKLNISESAERSLLRSIRRSVSDGALVPMDTLGASLAASKDAETRYYEAYGFPRPEFGISKSVFCGADWRQVKNNNSESNNSSKPSS